MEQKYGYVPALLKVKENFSSVSSTLDLKTPSVLTTVCGISSRLVHVTLVPTGTVSVAGPKLKLSIFTSVVSAFCCALASKFFWPTATVPTPITAATVRTAIDTLLLILFLLFNLISDQIGFLLVPVTRASNPRRPARAAPEQSSHR